MIMPDIDGKLELSGPRRRVEAIVRLEDVTMADAPSLVLAETRCASRLGEPCRFTLHVPDDALKSGRDYVLSARGLADPAGVAKPIGTVANYPWHWSQEALPPLILKELD